MYKADLLVAILRQGLKPSKKARIFVTIAKSAIIDAGRNKSFVKEIKDGKALGRGHIVAIKQSTYDLGIVKNLCWAQVNSN
jgi:hypothetical protein